MANGSTTAVTTPEAAAEATGDLWGAAERLRAVRRAHERFLGLWALDSLLDAPAAADRAWTDIGPVDPAADPGTPDNHALPDGLERSFFRRGRLDD